MLTIANLNQYYGGSHILRDLTFDVPDGKVTCLLGRNGVGKTTLLRTLMGVIPAKTGSVKFGELDLTRAKSEDRARAGIGHGAAGSAAAAADPCLHAPGRVAGETGSPHGAGRRSASADPAGRYSGPAAARFAG